MHDDVGTMLDGRDGQRRECVVDHDLGPVFMGDLRQGREIGNSKCRIRQRLRRTLEIPPGFGNFKRSKIENDLADTKFV